MVRKLTPSVLRPHVNVPVDPVAFLPKYNRMPSPVAAAGVKLGEKTLPVVVVVVFAVELPLNGVVG